MAFQCSRRPTHLPVEVVAHILQYMSVSDRKEAALVNHVWYDASLDPILLRDTVISFPAHAISADIIAGLARRRAPNLILENIDSSFQPILLMNKSSDYISNYLVSLSLKGSDIEAGTFINMLSKCHSLENLDLSCCNSLFMSGTLLSKEEHIATLRKTLVGVKELNLSSIRHLSDAVFNRVLRTCENVERIHLAGNQIIFYTDVHYSNRFAAAQRDNSAVFTFSNLVKQLGKIGTKINSLNFSRTTIDNNSLEDLAKIPGLVLEQLFLINCREMSDDGIIRFCQHQKCLVVLDVSQSVTCGDGLLAAVCMTQTNIQKLSISKLRVSDNAIPRLYNLKHLKNLNMSSCYMITQRGLIDTFKDGRSLNLTHLNLNCCSSVKDPFLFDVCQKLPNLSSLDVSSTGITDWGLILVSKYLTRLVSLRIGWCSHVTDNGLLGLLDGDEDVHVHDGDCKCTRQPESQIFRKPSKYIEPNQHVLDMKRRLHDLTNGEPVPLSNLQQLREFDITACGKITDSGMTAVLVGLRQLQTLRLSMCTKLTDQTLFTMSENNNVIEELNISNSINFTDKALVEVSRGLRRLTKLDISNCDNLTDVSINALRMHSKRLKHLDVSMNAQISCQAVDMLESSLPHLQQLQKRLVGARCEVIGTH